MQLSSIKYTTTILVLPCVRPNDGLAVPFLYADPEKHGDHTYKTGDNVAAVSCMMSNDDDR